MLSQNRICSAFGAGMDEVWFLQHVFGLFRYVDHSKIKANYTYRLANTRAVQIYPDIESNYVPTWKSGFFSFST